MSETHKRYLWLFIGTVLFLVSSGNWIVPVAAWLAPIFLLRFLRLTKPCRGLILLFIIFSVCTYFMLRGIIPPWLGVMSYTLTFYYAILWYLPYLADRLIAPRVRGFIGTLVFPTSMTAIDYLAGLAHGTWGSIAYTQYGNLPLMQIMSVTGMWGITFLVAWLGPVANWVWENKFEWSKVRTGVGIYSAIMILVLLYGGTRTAIFPPESETVRTAAITGKTWVERYRDAIERSGYSSLPELARDDPAQAGALTGAIHDGLLNDSRLEARAGARIIVWPESVTSVMQADEQEFIHKAKTLAMEEECYLLIAYNAIPLAYPNEFWENKATLIDPSGNIVWEYLKSHPAPGTAEIPGGGLIPTAETPFGKLAVAICYDMDFPDLINQAGRADVDIMLVPGWDWDEINPLHTQMAVFRAVENGFSMIRVTKMGLSMAADHQGRVLSTLDFFKTEDRAMVSQVPLRGTATIYSLVGDLFAWLSVAGLIALIIRRLVLGITARRGSASP